MLYVLSCFTNAPSFARFFLCCRRNFDKPATHLTCARAAKKCVHKEGMPLGRIRTIKPEFFKHSGLFDLEQETRLPVRLAFAGLWTCCDREGRFKWRPRELKLDILPYDECDFSRVLDALATRGFIVRYQSGDELLGCVPTWKQHQVINNKEKPSTLPMPQRNQQLDASATRESREGDASHTRGVKEGKGKEVEGKGNARAIRDARPVVPPSPGSGGEFMLAQELGKELKLAMGNSDIRIVAETIALQAEKHGGPLQAKDFIRDKALEARSLGTLVDWFWVKDCEFNQTKPMTERERKRAEFMRETEAEYGETPRA
ncbi:hypothetical protein [Occallatibacter savannae]|uniref:hypothetical protein n=1 Tax=Occallatibacter savannae TaxID=1002691 RepID=UPI00194E4353|nr:hypothetical protein [Occallatibacter savannae]